jgi:hypothetical protein
MAVELCKFALWLEGLEPGKPLSFLDHPIQCGNSLLGATPALTARGIPDCPSATWHMKSLEPPCGVSGSESVTGVRHPG